MLIICPKCFAQYAISDEIRIKKGQKFHCSACRNYFVSDKSENLSDEETDIIPTVSAVMQAAEQEEMPVMGVAVDTSLPVSESLSPVQAFSEVKPVEMSAQTDFSSSKSDGLSPTFEPEPIPAMPKFIDVAQEKTASETDSLSGWGKLTPNPEARLDSIPEAFKPVQKEPRKTSFFSALFWLAIAGGICYGAYMQKDFFIAQLDSFIVNQLDKPSKSAQKVLSDTPQMPENTSAETGVADEPDAKEAVIKESEKEQNESLETPTEKTDAKVEKESVKAVEKAKEEKSVEKAHSVKAEKQPVPTKEPIKADKAVQTPETARPSDPSVAQPAVPVVSQPQVVPAEKPLQVPVVAEEQPINLVEAANNTEPIPSELPELDAAVVQQINEPKAADSQQAELSALTPETEELPALTGLSDGLPALDLSSDVQQVSLDEETLKKELTQKEENTPENTTEKPQTVRERAVISESFAPLAEQATLSVSDMAKMLKIQDVSYVIAPNEAGVDRLTVKGNVVNTELKTLIIPEMKAVVYDDEDMVVARKRIVLSQPQIEGNSVQSFSSSVVPAPAQVNHVEVVFDE